MGDQCTLQSPSIQKRNTSEAVPEPEKVDTEENSLTGSKKNKSDTLR